jgi:hypothetical protein
MRNICRTYMHKNMYIIIILYIYYTYTINVFTIPYITSIIMLYIIFNIQTFNSFIHNHNAIYKLIENDKFSFKLK